MKRIINVNKPTSLFYNEKYIVKKTLTIKNAIEFRYHRRRHERRVSTFSLRKGAEIHVTSVRDTCRSPDEIGIWVVIAGEKRHITINMKDNPCFNESVFNSHFEYANKREGIGFRHLVECDHDDDLPIYDYEQYSIRHLSEIERFLKENALPFHFTKLNFKIDLKEVLDSIIFDIEEKLILKDSRENMLLDNEILSVDKLRKALEIVRNCNKLSKPVTIRGKLLFSQIFNKMIMNGVIYDSDNEIPAIRKEIDRIRRVCNSELCKHELNRIVRIFEYACHSILNSTSIINGECDIKSWGRSGSYSVRSYIESILSDSEREKLNEFMRQKGSRTKAFRDIEFAFS